MNYRHLLIAASFFILTTTASAATTTDMANYWSFNDAAGRTVLDSAGGKTGTLVGSSTGFGWTTGQSETALAMDGADGTSVELPDGALSGTSGTLSFWMRFSDFTDRNIIFSTQAKNENYIYMVLFVDHDGRLSLKYRSATDGVEHLAQGSKILNRNEWYHIVFISDGTYGLYVNGEKFDMLGYSSGVWFSNLNANYTFRYTIGAGTGLVPGVFSGALDEMKVYNRTLSLDEVALLYNNGNAGVPLPPLALRAPVVPVTEVLLTPQAGTATATPSVPAPATTTMTTEKPVAPGLLIAAWKRSLRVGSSGEDVRNLQLFLIRHGLLAEGNAIGYFGPRTKAAVIKFQLANNLPGTGFFGPLSQAKVNVLNK